MLNPVVDSARRQINLPYPDECLFTLRLQLRHAVEASLVGLKPKAAFLPLFNLDEPVGAGEIVLATSLTAGALDSTPTPDTLLLLPSGIKISGIESWVQKLADVA